MNRGVQTAVTARDQKPEEYAVLKNADRLLSHGATWLRRIALDIADHALAGADPYAAVHSLVRIKGDRLFVDQLQFDLAEINRIVFLGAGKASFGIAKALEEILGDRLAEGVVICKYGQAGTLDRIRMHLASHPVPDEAGAKATEDVVALARRTRFRDLVFCGITGGSSALMPMPVAGLTLADKQEVTRLLLNSGADIFEINAVRKHLSQIKGGGLATMIDPGAYLINLTVSDVIGDRLDYITDPTVPDTSTLTDARRTLTRYDLWSRVPASVREHLREGGEARETPKRLPNRQLYNFIIIRGTAACEAAAARAKQIGFNPLILTTMLDGESRSAGRLFGNVAAEVLGTGRPVTAPCAIIAGGETVVVIDNEAGKGGPNQEFVAGAMQSIADLHGVVILGLDTDGTDGPGDLAGAIADHLSASRAAALELSVDRFLRDHNVGVLFAQLGDGIVTGATGTNVNDLKLMLISPFAPD